MTEYAISDIHGCNKTFQALLDKIGFNQSDKLYLLGDYIDRGPDSKGVLDSIINMQANGYEVFVLKGNHEQLLYDAYKNVDWDSVSMWINNGGKATMESFDCTNIRLFPVEYIQFIEKMQYYIELPNYYLVHAGFDFEKNNPFEDEYAMLWIRRWYQQIDETKLNGKKIVHGHTPTPLTLIQHLLATQDYPAINIDAGCFAQKEGYGHLCALNLTTEELIWQKRTDY